MTTTMGSRVRENAKLLFDLYCEVSGNNGEEPVVINKYPQSYNDSELSKVPDFAFPCKMDETNIQNYSFVLTSMDSKYTFGYCRFDPKSKIAMVVLSAMPWHDIFYRFLNCIAPLSRKEDKSEMLAFLAACHVRPPMVGHTLRITYNNGDVFQCEHPDEVLPSIPGNYNITLFFSSLEWRCMAGLFAALLHERRIVVVATKPSRLSAVVQAANALLYPMSWQHIFIPILPKRLSDYLLAPMPFLVGVPRSVMNNVRLTDVGEIVLVDADNNELKTPFDDLESLPTEVVSALRKALNDKNTLGDSVSRAFLRALVHLIGGYRNAIRIEKRQTITFNPDEFVKTRKSMEPFLTKILQSQIFQQFIEERLELLNSGRGFSDVFEIECYEYAEKTNGGSGHKMKQQYKEWAKAMKREGGAILKTVRDKANPAMKSAVNSFRQGGRNVKSAVKGLKMKMPKSTSRSSTADDSRSTSSSSSASVGSQASTQSAPVSPQKMGLSLLEEMNLVIPLHCDTKGRSTGLVNISGSLGSKAQDNSKFVASKDKQAKPSGTVWHTFEEVNSHIGQMKSNIDSSQPVRPSKESSNYEPTRQAQDLMDFSETHDFLRMDSTEARLSNLLDAFDPLKSNSLHSSHTSPASQGGVDKMRNDWSRSESTLASAQMSEGNLNPFRDGFSSLPRGEFDPFRLQQGNSWGEVSFDLPNLSATTSVSESQTIFHGGSPFTISPVPSDRPDEGHCMMMNDQALLREYGIDFNRFDLNAPFLESDNENESINKNSANENERDVRASPSHNKRTI